MRRMNSPLTFTAGAMQGTRVLVADDNEDLRLLMDATLAMAGAEVTLADDGIAAAEHLAAAQFDLLVCDVELPGIGGWELTRRLRTAGSPLPTIIVSGHVGPEAAEASRNAGACAHLDKPFTLDALIACCRQALDVSSQG